VGGETWGPWRRRKHLLKANQRESLPAKGGRSERGVARSTERSSSRRVEEDRVDLTPEKEKTKSKHAYCVGVGGWGCGRYSYFSLSQEPGNDRVLFEEWGVPKTKDKQTFLGLDKLKRTGRVPLQMLTKVCIRREGSGDITLASESDLSSDKLKHFFKRGSLDQQS